MQYEAVRPRLESQDKTITLYFISLFLEKPVLSKALRNCSPYRSLTLFDRYPGLPWTTSVEASSQLFRKPNCVFGAVEPEFIANRFHGTTSEGPSTFGTGSLFNNFLYGVLNV
jgi:hypothetical protein